MTVEKVFKVTDYAVFGAMLLASAGIGVYFACTGGKQKTSKEWLTGNKSLAWLPTSLSLLASFISAITLLGTPAEMYSNNTMYLYLSLSYFFVMPICAHIFMPVYRRLGITSVFEYLERRFHLSLRILAAVIASFSLVIYMSIVLYAPALALSAVTGMSKTFSLLACGGVCTFYTVIGGMKAVVWADALQTIIMLGGMILILVLGSIRVGGSAFVMEISQIGNRMVLDDWTLDPRKRHSALGMILGGTFTWAAVYCVNQAEVQRYSSIRTKAGAFKAIYLNLPGLMVIMYLSGACGLLAFSRYALCDPLTTGEIDKSDQILPFFVADLFPDIPGFTGLFVASIMSGALSTVSSGVNAVTGIVLNDLVVHCVGKEKLQSIQNDERSGTITKMIAVFFGLLPIGISFLAEYLGPVLQVALSFRGVLTGPILGMVGLGILSRKAKWRPTFVGVLVAVFFNSWILFGSLYMDYKQELPNHFTNHCDNITMSSGDWSLVQPAKFESTSNRLEALRSNMYVDPTKPATDTSHWTFVENYLYRISYMWYALISVVIVFVIGYIGSFFDPQENIPDPNLTLIARDCWSTEEATILPVSSPEDETKNIALEEINKTDLK